MASPDREAAAPAWTAEQGDASRRPDAADRSLNRTMSSAADLVDGWLRRLDLEPTDRAEREGVVSWDLSLDGRRRHDIRMTLILDPALALVAWVQYAPPLSASFRLSYRQFLRWNDELPFVKFALSEDERPVLTSEIPVAHLDCDAVGLAIARMLAVCDLLLDESVAWLWPGRRAAPDPVRPSRHAHLLDRYAHDLAELAPPAPELETPAGANMRDVHRLAAPAAGSSLQLPPGGDAGSQQGPEPPSR